MTGDECRERRNADAADADDRRAGFAHALARECEPDETGERRQGDQRQQVHRVDHPFIVVAASTSSVLKRR